MTDFLKHGEYPKLKRLPIGPGLDGKKDTLIKENHLRLLLEQDVLIEEKMDGRTAKFTADNGRLSIFCEDLKWRHSIRYKVPARFAIFDIFDNQRTYYLDAEAKEDIC